MAWLGEGLVSLLATVSTASRESSRTGWNESEKGVKYVERVMWIGWVGGDERCGTKGLVDGAQLSVD